MPSSTIENVHHVGDALVRLCNRLEAAPRFAAFHSSTAWRSMLFAKRSVSCRVCASETGLRSAWNTSRGIPYLVQRVQELPCEGTAHHADKLVCIVSISFMLKSRITPTLILPIGAKTSEFDTSRR